MDSCLPEAVGVGSRGNRVEDERPHAIHRSGTALRPRARLRSGRAVALPRCPCFQKLVFGGAVHHRRSTSCRSKVADVKHQAR